MTVRRYSDRELALLVDRVIIVSHRLRHRGAVVPQVMEVEILQASSPGGSPEGLADLLAAVRPPTGAREDPLAGLVLELLGEDLPGRLAQYHRAGTGLRLREHHELPEL